MCKPKIPKIKVNPPAAPLAPPIESQKAPELQDDVLSKRKDKRSSLRIERPKRGASSLNIPRG